MKKFKILSVAFAAMITLTLTSCQKDLSRTEQEHQVPAANAADATLAGCSVLNIQGNGVIKAKFTYNALGNPDRIKVDNPGTGNPNRVFWYDAANRLTDNIGYYDSETFEDWHKYGYNALGDVAIDTVYIFGTRSGGQPVNYYDRYISHFKYDAQGRIKKVTGGGVNGTYTYDANGNLINGSTYDTKKNIHRTNAIWQFLDRDYSVNNPMNTSAYKNGYPSKVFVDEGTEVFGFLQLNFYGDITIKYSCN